MKRYIVFSIIICLALQVVAQRVSNVSFRQEGKMVYVSYDLSEQANIAVEVSIDGGLTYGTPKMTHVSGDVGENISAGKGKRIVWDVLQDCDKLQGDRVCFSVTATKGGANQTVTVNGVSFTMVYVDGGTFTMGCTSEQGGDCDSDEKPAHSVTLSDFYIGETEVTQALWKAVMGNNPSSWKGDQLPVETVSWDDCQTFIRKLSNLTGRTFRLPTEAEWEYAARGGKRSKGYKYSGSTIIDDVAWYDGNSGSKTHAVKGKRANELGLYDMSGNVSEWCSDWKGEYSSGLQSNPKGPSSGSVRVCRGGSRYLFAQGCRVSNRNNCVPSIRDDYLGFRLVLVP